MVIYSVLVGGVEHLHKSFLIILLFFVLGSVTLHGRGRAAGTISTAQGRYNNMVVEWL